MSNHRAEQIADQVVAILQTSAHVGAAGAAVVEHRARSIAPDALEVPTVSVRIGDDLAVDTLDGSSNFAFFDSEQVLHFDIVVAGESDDAEQHVLDELYRWRRGVHRALMADDQLGLTSIVIGTRYAGADAPRIEIEGERLIGRLECRWRVHYRMAISDPA